MTTRPESRTLYTQAEAKVTIVSMFIVKYCLVALPVYCIILGLLPLITSLGNAQPMMIEMYPAR